MVENSARKNQVERLIGFSQEGVKVAEQEMATMQGEHLLHNETFQKCSRVSFDGRYFCPCCMK